MSDKNKNSQIDPDEATEVVEEEGVVNKEYREEKISPEKIHDIDSFEKLSKEAERIEMEKGMGSSTGFTSIKPEEIKAEMPPEEEKEPEEEQPPVSASTPAEATQEVVQEVVEEVKQEANVEPQEINKEFKPGI